MINFNFDANILLAKYWNRRSTVLVLILLLLLFGVPFFAEVDVEKVTLYEWIALVVLSIGIYLIWFLTSRTPKAPKDSIGIAIALSAESPEQQKRLSADLVAELKKALEGDVGEKNFNVIELSTRFSSQISSIDDARKIRKKANCKFILWGTAKSRKIKGKDTHVIDMQIQVGHSDIPQEVSRKFGSELSEYFPRKLHIDQSNDLAFFQFTSDWMDLVARYSIGMSFALSGFVDEAERIFLELHSAHKLRKNLLPPIMKLVSKLPQRILEIKYWRASQAYELWRLNRDISIMDQIHDHLEPTRGLVTYHYGSSLLWAIYYFVKHRNTERAIIEIKKCRNERDATWRYSYAFLNAYNGDLRRASRLYRSAFSSPYERLDIAIQTEEFLLWVLANEPEKYQLYFCLGLINWHAKNDLNSALSDFKKFIEEKDENTFQKESDLAEKYIAQIQRELER